jgi:hypothetical protein
MHVQEKFGRIIRQGKADTKTSMTDPAWLIYMYMATYDLSEHSEHKFLIEDKLPKTLGRVISGSISKSSTAR